MFSSHGCFAPLPEILELEDERDNDDVNDIRKFIRKNPKLANALAIWLMYDALDCFMHYCSDAYGNVFSLTESREEVEVAYPDYLDEIAEVDATDLILVCEDGSDGYLYVKKL
ncbi:hypothetical protein AGMMS49975_19430 [Clostridia bacterium]|nr:hypothetical protein AGMMS49975_19430 [Clostridia bacterium]